MYCKDFYNNFEYMATVDISHLIFDMAIYILNVQSNTYWYVHIYIYLYFDYAKTAKKNGEQSYSIVHNLIFK